MDSIPKCPICNAEMVQRLAKKGKNKGYSFWGCSNYFKTGCKGSINIENDVKLGQTAARIENRELFDDEKIHIPTYFSGRELYSGFKSKFIQSISIPDFLLKRINEEELDRKILEMYSQWRMDYKFTSTRKITNGLRDAYRLIQKLLTRGILTLSSEELEKSYASFCNVDPNKDSVDFSCYINHTVRDSRNTILLDSDVEEKFYNETLNVLLGESYTYYTIPQVSLDCLLENNSANYDREHRRVDFLITTPKNDIIIELDGSEHAEHSQKDEIRNKELLSEGYKVIRIPNDDYANLDYFNEFEELSDIRNDVRKFEELSSSQELMIMLKVSHQIQIAIIEALISGVEGEYQADFYVEFSSKLVDEVKSKFICESIEKEINMLLDQVRILMGTRDESIKINIYPYECNSIIGDEDTLISYKSNHLVANNIVIQDVIVNKTFSNPSYSSNLNFYKEPSEENLEFFLNYLFRKQKFREGQFETISRGLQGKDTLVLLPTGAGKSIAFQLTSLLLPGVSIVIEPILALMDDQIENLSRIGIDRIVGINSQITERKIRQKVIDAFSMGEYLISYVAPERFQTNEFRTSLTTLTTITPVSMIAIDEAHCVSEWGHDFRTAYLNIGRTSREFCGIGNKKPCLIGLTGTASNAVLRDVQRELNITDFDAIITPKTFNRKELTYRFFKCSSSEKEHLLTNILARYLPEEFSDTKESFYNEKEENTNSGLVFCPHVNGNFGVLDVSEHIRKNMGLETKFYAGTEPKKFGGRSWSKFKKDTARGFKNNKFPLLVTTKAFGMGIDKPNIRYTIHYGLPSSIESFYQEAGRAGRDSQSSKCLLIVSNDNIQRTKSLMDVLNPISTLNEIIGKDRNFETDDDVTRAMFFHLQAFRGIEEELDDIQKVIKAIGNLEKPRRLNLTIEKMKRNQIEKSLYRLIILGVVKDYTLDYSSDEFHIQLNNLSHDEIIDRYAQYVSGYNRSRVNQEANKLQGIFDLPYEQFILESCKVLISFIYDTIEKGRRRGFNEMLLLAETAVNSDNPDEVIRTRILRYLETTYSEEIERVLNEDQLGLKAIRDLFDGHETNDGRVIGGLRSPRDAEQVRGQVSRYLESTPDHPGLLILRALSELFASDYSKTTVVETLNAAIQLANGQIGFSIEKEEFYKLIAWTIAKIDERDHKLYTEVIIESMYNFNEVDFAKYVIKNGYLSNIYEPSAFVFSKYADNIKKIIRR